jgi:protein SHQ1
MWVSLPFSPPDKLNDHLLDLATTTQTHNLYLTLVTLLFSYAYDARTTQHDPTPESAWTISVLTPAFSALDPPPYPDLYSASEVTPSVMTATLVPCYRRALAFPLHRSFQLVEACRIDTAQFLSAGKRTVVRCLLEMKHILDHHETYYVYSKIWVDDFCSWTQACARFVLLILVSDVLFLMTTL